VLSPDGPAATSSGESPADRVLTDLGLEPIPVSKYRVGMSLVGGAKRAPQPGADLFEAPG
jgi:hypothetical protein